MPGNLSSDPGNPATLVAYSQPSRGEVATVVVRAFAHQQLDVGGAAKSDTLPQTWSETLPESCPLPPRVHTL